MAAVSQPIFRQPLVGIVTGCTALLALTAAWVRLPLTLAPASVGATLLIAGVLIAGVILAYQFPIHVHYRLKIAPSSVPIYLLAVLLPPALAVTAAALALLAAELSVRAQRGTYISDIVTQTGRMMIAVLLTSLLPLAFPVDAWGLLTLMPAALVLWALESLTVPLQLAPITGEAPRQILQEYWRQAGTVEGAQYLIGILGAVAMVQQPLSLVFLVLPTMLVQQAFKSVRELSDGTRQMLESLADTVDLRDMYTGGHSRRVTELCAGILRELPMEGPDADLILTAARLHDIGKIGVPDAVLHKAGPLTTEERAVMETHPARGAELLQRHANFTRGVAVVRHHHERWDGQGYPDRLRGTEIPLGARVVAVAESFDAMTSDRP
jgi:HD-GYP domain-containing protein (c-di-GMP phosphodiesterase class II)